jgi:hypothetical protein
MSMYVSATKGIDNAEIKEASPVIDGALIIVVYARPVSIKLAHAYSQEMAIVRDDDLALVIFCALVEVNACSAKDWDAYADTEVSHLRFNRSAEAWAPVALIKVVVTVLSADGAGLFWGRDASARIAIATAQAPEHWLHYIPSKMKTTKAMEKGGSTRVPSKCLMTVQIFGMSIQTFRQSKGEWDHRCLES